MICWVCVFQMNKSTMEHNLLSQSERTLRGWREGITVPAPLSSSFNDGLGCPWPLGGHAGSTIRQNPKQNDEKERERSLREENAKGESISSAGEERPLAGDPSMEPKVDHEPPRIVSIETVIDPPRVLNPTLRLTRVDGGRKGVQVRCGP